MHILKGCAFQWMEQQCRALEAVVGLERQQKVGVREGEQRTMGQE
jgi:hypothetical protein